MTKRNTHQKSTYEDSAVRAGLSVKAATVYVALLEAEESISPKSIIIRTGLHRQYVYDAIRELQDRTLIGSIGKDRSVRYHALSPAKLVHEVEKRRIDTLNGVQNLMQLYGRVANTNTDAGAEQIGTLIPSVQGEFDRLVAIERGLQEVKEAIRALSRPGRGHTV